MELHVQYEELKKKLADLAFEKTIEETNLEKYNNTPFKQRLITLINKSNRNIKTIKSSIIYNQKRLEIVISKMNKLEIRKNNLIKQKLEPIKQLPTKNKFVPKIKEYLIKIHDCSSINIENELKKTALFNTKNATHERNYSIRIADPDSSRIMDKMDKYEILKNWDLDAFDEIHMTNFPNTTTKTANSVVLWKGEMFHQFKNDFNPATHYVDKFKAIRQIKNSRFEEKKKSIYNYRLIHRIQTNFSNERTMIATIIPPDSILSNSIQYIHFNNISYSKMVYLCGILNSFVTDFYVRRIVNTNINQKQLKQIPVKKYSKLNRFHKQIVIKTSLLLFQNKNMKELQRQLQNENIKFPKLHKFTLNDKLNAEAEINAAVIVDYDIDDKDMEIIFKSFDIQRGDRDIKLENLIPLIRKHVKILRSTTKK